MAAPGSYKVRVFEPKIQGMFVPGGEVNKEATFITTRIEVRAIEKASAFSPSGQAGRGDTIISNHARRVIDSGAIYQTRGYVENNSGHALYKHNGNGPLGSKIKPKRASYMRIPAGPWGPRRVTSVYTYEGDPWLLDAANEILLQYGVQLPPQ